MPLDNSTQAAVIVIAVAVSIQTLLCVSAFVVIALRWRRLELTIDRRFETLGQRVDDAVRDTRRAADAVSRMSDQASGLMGDAGGVLRWVTTAVDGPRALVVAGAATAARGLLTHWRRRGRDAPSAAAGGKT